MEEKKIFCCHTCSFLPAAAQASALLVLTTQWNTTLPCTTNLRTWMNQYGEWAIIQTDYDWGLCEVKINHKWNFFLLLISFHLMLRNMTKHRFHLNLGMIRRPCGTTSSELPLYLNSLQWKREHMTNITYLIIILSQTRCLSPPPCVKCLLTGTGRKRQN